MKAQTRFLASVTSLDEARLAARHGADIIDLKNPAAGALGALEAGTIAGIVAGLRGRQLLSATIGDMPLVPDRVGEAVRQTADHGVDIVKVGWFSDHLPANMLPVLQQAAADGIRLVVVLFAEYGTQIGYLAQLAATGIHGVMLDTCDKATGSLRDKVKDGALADFIRIARQCELVSGLAGSLQQSDIVPLLHLQPDYLGFRGALCGTGERTAGLEAMAVESVRLLIREPLTAADQDFTACEVSNVAS